MAFFRDEIGFHTEEPSLVAGTATVFEIDLSNYAGVSARLEFTIQAQAVGVGGDIFGVSGRYLGFFQYFGESLVPVPADASPIILIQDGGLKYDTDIGTAPTVAAEINGPILTIEAGAADCNAQWVTEGSLTIWSCEVPEEPPAP